MQLFVQSWRTEGAASIGRDILSVRSNSDERNGAGRMDAGLQNP